MCMLAQVACPWQFGWEGDSKKLKVVIQGLQVLAGHIWFPSNVTEVPQSLEQ